MSATAIACEGKNTCESYSIVKNNRSTQSSCANAAVTTDSTTRGFSSFFCNYFYLYALKTLLFCAPKEKASKPPHPLLPHYMYYTVMGTIITLPIKSSYPRCTQVQEHLSCTLELEENFGRGWSV